MISEGGGFFVTLFSVPAGGTVVIVVEIIAMGPTVVRVGAETGLPSFVFCFLLRWVSEENLLVEGRGDPDLPPKAAEFFAVSDDFDQHDSGRRYLYGATDGSGRWMERQECNTKRNVYATENGGTVVWWRRRRRQRQRRRQRRKGKLAQISRK